MNTKTEIKKSTWRTFFKVHPAADVFPLLPDVELRALGEDIKKNGLKEAVTMWCPENGDPCVIDGRNRLAAMEMVGVTISAAHTVTIAGNINPAAFIISKNIRRRHLTKEQQADLIVTVMTVSTDLAKLAKSVTRDSNGRVQGSAKDPIKEKAIEEGKKHDLSKRTIERALAKAKGPTLPPRKPGELKLIAPRATTTTIPTPVIEEAQILTGHIEADKPANNNPAFKGSNSYEVKFLLDGTRLDKVKKRILELFPDFKDDIQVISLNGKGPSRAERLEEAKSTVQELLEEIQNWRDNLPENFQSGEKADALDECIESLETITSDMDGVEFPSAFGN